MKRAALIFESVHVREAPGIPGGLEKLEDLTSGVNVIHGPNGSGKSTTLRLMQASLSSGSGSRQGHFSDEDWCESETKAGEVSHRTIIRAGAGRQSDPSMVEIDNGIISLCRISLKELLEASGRERFGEELESAAAGGVNLVRIARDAGLENRKTPRPKDRNELKTKFRELEAAVKFSASHQAQEEELEEQEKARESVSERLNRLLMLNSAIEHRQQLEAGQLAKEHFETYPETLSRLSGQECEELRHAEHALSSAREKHDTAAERKAAAEAKLRDSPLEGRIEKGILGECEAHAARMGGLESQIRSATGSLTSALGSMADARRFIGEEASDESLLAVATAELKQLEGWCDKVEELEGRKAAIRELRGQLGDLEERPRSRHGEAIELLTRWKAATRLDHRAAQSRIMMICGALLFLAAGITLGILLHPWYYAVCAGTLLFGVSWWLLREGRAAEVEREFVQAGFTPPETWTAGDVECLLAEEEGAQERELEQRGRSGAWKEQLSSRENEIENEETEIASQQNFLIQELGFAPVLGEKSFGILARHLMEWNRASGEERAAKETVQHLEKEQSETRQKVRDLLASYSLSRLAEDFSSEQLLGWLANLREWDSDYADASLRLQNATAEIENAEEAAREHDEEIDRIYAAADLEKGDRDGLTDLVSRVEAYREAREKHNGYRVVVENAKRWFEEHSELQDISTAALEEERLGLGDPKSELDDINQSIGALERDLENARKATAVEKKRSEFEEERARLHAEREERLEQAAGWLLANRIHQKVASETVPEVQQRAAGLLTAFTDGKCRIDVRDGTLMALQPEISSTPFQVEELSDGTRVQLFIAMRLAFIERQEGALQLPLFLDEALANSDDRRAQALMNALAEVADGGRQVLYFTSQGDEAAKWKESLDGRGIPFSVFPLRKDFVLPESTANLAPRETVPAPRSGEAMADYRERLGLPGKVDPWVESADQILLGHVLEAPEDLARFHGMGVHAWGALSGLSAASANLKGGNASFERSRKQARLILEVARLWRQGRGQPLRPSDLEAGGVTNTASNDRLEQAWRIAEKVDGDAERLCAVLDSKEERVDGLGPGGIRKLRQHCEDRGLIADGDPLSDGEIRLGVEEFARHHEIDDKSVEAVLALFSDQTAG
ncbi:AAA family ATPase [Verrucomicrobiales bacterium]|nr:AAA family ATPase [Verrucomicrobiales bacterium]